MLVDIVISFILANKSFFLCCEKIWNVSNELFSTTRCAERFFNEILFSASNILSVLIIDNFVFIMKR